MTESFFSRHPVPVRLLRLELHSGQCNRAHVQSSRRPPAFATMRLPPASKVTGHARAVEVNPRGPLAADLRHPSAGLKVGFRLHLSRSLRLTPLYSICEGGFPAQMSRRPTLLHTYRSGIAHADASSWFRNDRDEPPATGERAYMRRRGRRQSARARRADNPSSHFDTTFR